MRIFTSLLFEFFWKRSVKFLSKPDFHASFRFDQTNFPVKTAVWVTGGEKELQPRKSFHGCKFIVSDYEFAGFGWFDDCPFMLPLCEPEPLGVDMSEVPEPSGVDMPEVSETPGVLSLLLVTRGVVRSAESTVVLDVLLVPPLLPPLSS